MKKLLSLVALLGVLVPTLAACGSVESVAATVNGRDITESELQEELRAIEGNTAYVEGLQQPRNPQQAPLRIQGRGTGTLDSSFVARVLSRQILLELVSERFDREGLELGERELDDARRSVAQQVGGEEVYRRFPKDYRETLARRSAEVIKLQSTLGEVDTDDAAVERFYRENREQFSLNCARHILVETAEQAAALRARIAAGEPFEQVAAAESTDPGSKDDGGDLGCQPPGTFVPPFEQALAALEVNELSQPVQTSFGYHLIVVYERRQQPLSEVADQIRQQLLSQSGEAFNEFLQEAAETARISVNPRYGRWDQSQLPGAVVPPEPPVPGGNRQDDGEQRDVVDR